MQSIEGLIKQQIEKALEGLRQTDEPLHGFETDSSCSKELNAAKGNCSSISAKPVCDDLKSGAAEIALQPTDEQVQPHAAFPDDSANCVNPQVSNK